jgi:hypothetical protein
MKMYSTNSTVELFDKKARENTVEITKRLANHIASAEKLIDIQCNIASYFMGWWSSNTPFAHSGHSAEIYPLLISSFHKNIFSLFSALRLSSCGLYGADRSLMRNIFEWLMISKFSAISDNPSVMKKWHNEETIYFSNSVLKKIKVPSPEEFFTFWSIACEYSHATRSSLQISLDIDDEENFKDIKINVAVINALLECNYHLLNTHLITSEYEYMGKFYYGPRFSKRPKYKVPELRKAAHSIFKSNRKFLGAGSVKLISAYKRKWVLSP